jgi:hypothetical protein
LFYVWIPVAALSLKAARRKAATGSKKIIELQKKTNKGELTMKKRPFGVTVLALLAGLAAVFAAIHALQALKILPYMIGPFTVHAFSFWSFLMWALMVWIWVWVVQMLWRVDPQAWLFLAVISVFNLILDFTVMLGAGDWSDVSVSFILNAIILIYVMLPSVKRAFAVD